MVRVRVPVQAWFSMLRFFFRVLFFSFIFLFRQALGSRRIGQYSIIARIFTGRIVNVRGIGMNVL